MIFHSTPPAKAPIAPYRKNAFAVTHSNSSQYDQSMVISFHGNIGALGMTDQTNKTALAVTRKGI